MLKNFIRRNLFGNMAYILTTILILNFSFGSGIQAANAATETDMSEKVHLRWIVMGSGDQKDKKLVESSINEYLEDKINATLDIITLMWGMDFDNKLNLMIAAGEPYDINFTASWAADYRHLASIGAYRDLTGMLDTYAPKTKALLGNNILKGAEVNGRVYALPVYNPSNVSSNGILLNSSLVKKYDIDVSRIEKLQDLEPILKNIKSKEKKTIPFYPFDKGGSEGVINTLNYDKISLDSPGAVLRDGKSTKVLNEFETNDAKSLFSLMNKWYKAGYISKSAKYDIDFYKRNSADIFAMYSNITALSHDNVINDYNIDIVPVYLGKSSITTSGVTTLMHAISVNSRNPERALMFLELVNTDEKLSNLINYGIEGLHYEKTGNSTIVQLPQGESRYNPDTPWLFGNQTIAYSLPGWNPESWSILDKDVKNAVASPLLGFSFEPAPVQNQITKINSIKKKYLNDLTIGKVNSDSTLAKMNTEMKKAGLQKILSEMQKQVDKFQKSK